MTKVCNICETEKSLSEFYRNCKSSDGVLTCCKVCSEKKKATRLLDPEYQSRVRAQRAALHLKHKEKHNARSNAQYLKNKDTRLADANLYYKENAEARSVYAKSRRSESRIVTRKYREVNRERVTRVNKLWRINNPDKLAKNAVVRRAREKQAIPLWAADEWDSFVVAELYHLSNLRFQYTGVKYHVDHIVPLQSDSVCGLHCAANLQLLPAKENISKGNRYWPDMW